MRKYEGLISEEREMYLNSIEWMAYEEHNAYIQSHPEILSEKVTQIEKTEMSPKEMCDKYGLVDMTNFFISHGVKLQD